MSSKDIKLPKKYIQDDLNQDIWNGDVLKEDILEKLRKIAQDFYEYIKVDVPMEGIWFTGSLANYNWTDFSDIDLHILVDYNKINDDQDLVSEYLDSKKNNWLSNHNIKIKEFDVELYAQDINEEHTSTGVYDVMNDKWIRKPSKKNPSINKRVIKNKILNFTEKIDKILSLEDSETTKVDAEKIKDKIKKMRQSGLSKKGEYSEENLAFKYLRNHGYIEKLFDKIRSSYDKTVSIEESESSSTFDYDEKINLIDSDEIVAIVQSLHSREEDFDEGDLIDRIKQFKTYKLTNIPINNVDTDEFLTDVELVDEYVEKIKNNPDYPPIVFDPINSSIIDGMHRVQALEELGYETIRAYVGVEKSDDMNESNLRNFIKETFDTIGFHASMEDWVNKWKGKGVDIDSNTYGEEGMDMGFKKSTLLSEDEITADSYKELSPSEFDVVEVEIGKIVEREHTEDEEEILNIVLDHLRERGDYYSKAIECGLIDEPEALEVYKKQIGELPENIEEEFKSKKQQRYFYAMANKPGKVGKKWKKMADEFSKETNYDNIKENEIAKLDLNKTFKIDNVEKLKNIGNIIKKVDGMPDVSSEIILSQEDDAIIIPIEDYFLYKEAISKLIKEIKSIGYKPVIHKNDKIVYLIVDLRDPTFNLNESFSLAKKDGHKLYFEEDLNEEHGDNIEDFIEFIKLCCKEGSINEPTIIHLRSSRDKHLVTTASYNPNNHNIHIYAKGRHKVDIMRSIAHELMHMVQMLEDRLYPNSGDDGSNEENEAHSFSGLMIRKFGKIKPEIYE
jgi:ribosomal protein L17